MLGPHDRRLLLDAVRPPEGYVLDFAVGTTYSLDLLALLTAPLAFTLLDCQDADGRPDAAALPAMAQRPLPDETRSRIERCAHELRRVTVEPPDGFDGLSYWPLGITGKRSWPFDRRYGRLLVVSPFLSETFLGEVTGSADE